MRRWIPIAIIVGLLFGFVIIAQAIISVKLLELRVKISRERILNYELSSKVLKERFINLLESEQKGFDGEIRQSVLEASIMNDKDPEALELTKGEYAGLLVINVVRQLSLKPFLHLMADQEQLILMKYAFFMERNRRYNQAAEKYKFLEEIMSKDTSDARGFVILHHGYCLAVGGKPKQALDKLYQVRDDFSGTHYSQTAAVLIELLLEGERQKKSIESQELSNLEKARKYFLISQFSQAVKLYFKEPHLSAMDEYQLSRSREETGNVKQAIEGYLKIVNENTDPQAVKLANRRLLLIGNFYGGGKKVKQFAEQKAIEIGDKAAVQDIEVAAAARRKDIILEEIREKNTSNQSSDPLFEQLGKELESNIVLEEKITKIQKMVLVKPKIPVIPQISAINIDEQTKNIKSVEKFVTTNPQDYMLDDPGLSARMFPDARFELKLADGRLLKGQEMIFQKDSVKLVNGSLEFNIPILVIQNVSKGSEINNQQKTVLFLVLKDGEKVKISRIESIREEKIYIIDEMGKKDSYDLEDVSKVLFP